jgi:RHS repeat-associated protein
VIEKYKYDAFGAPTVYDGSGNLRPGATIHKNRFMFTGREYAATFGFYEYRARAYNPVLGRFMSEDPKLFDGGDYNLFRYSKTIHSI